MADETKQDGGKAAAPKAKSEAPAESRYARDEHIKLAHAMYGVPAHEVSGALALREQDGEPAADYTKSEVESAISAFRRHKITQEN